jgi:co-chaperonin GroES (HSP10)
MTNQIEFTPTRDWVVVEMQDTSKTESGIILAGGAEKSMRKNIVKVVATGPKCETVKPGDKVMVHPTSEGIVLNLDSGKFILINEFTICGVFP